MALVARPRDSRAFAARRRAPIRRGRCPTLVAAAVGSGRPHPNVRRSRWLAYVVAHYLGASGDRRCSTKVCRSSKASASSRTRTRRSSPPVASRRRQLFEHCALALDVSLSLGAHGLPLIGTGDWNDGMNRVGKRPRRKCVARLAPARALTAFVPLAEAHDETVEPRQWRTLRSASLRTRRLGRPVVSSRLF